MIKSMTGFGRGEAQDDTKKFTVEMKSVNHRFSEIVVRMPKFYSSLEDKIRKIIQQQVSRGRVDVFISYEEVGTKTKQVKVDKELALAYHNALRELEGTLNKQANQSLMDIARFPDVLKVEEDEEDLEKEWQVLKKAVEKAANQLVEMRGVEGAKLKKDLQERVETIGRINEEIKERSPKVVEEYKERLGSRIKELLGDVQIDETRLVNEVAFFADRCSITEETVRLQSHLDQIKESLNSHEAVGRKQDFLVQELYREINTIGSKANDMEIAAMVISAKSEIEKIREQVQNIE